MSLLLAVLLCCDDTALAGAAYQEAQEALREAHYDDAVRKLQEALRLEPRETDRLLYRDRQGRQKVAYFPHFLWAEARTLQARDEKDPQARTRLLREALTHLDLTSHPSAGERREAVKKDLALAEKAAAAAAAPPEPDPALLALRADVAALSNQERFEDARDRLERDKELLDRTPGERDQIGAVIESRRQAVVARYERTLTVALETAAATSPLEKPDLILSLLQTAVLPTAVLRVQEGRFLWLRDFLALYAREVPVIRRPDDVDLPRLLGSARAFDTSAAKAIEAGSVPAYRMAARVADVLRDHRLAALWIAADEAALDRLLADEDLAVRSREALLLKSPELVAPRRESLKAARLRLEERRALVRELQAWTGRAEKSLDDRSTMSDPAALRAIAREQSSLEQKPRWIEMTDAVQGRVIFDRAVLDLVADALGADGANAAETAARLRKAKHLSPGIETAWVDRLSPKLRERLQE
jgi:hypothetical protein